MDVISPPSQPINSNDLANPQTDQRPPANPKPRPVDLDVWLMSRPGSGARRIGDDVHSRLLVAEVRSRKRRAADAATFAALVDMLVANLVRFHLRQPHDGYASAGYHWLGVLTGKEHLQSRGRYGRAPVPQRSRTMVIEAMEGLGILVLNKAPRHFTSTRPSYIRLGSELLTLVDAHQPTLADVTTRLSFDDDSTDGPEVILLRGAAALDLFTGRKRKGPFIEFQDSTRTNGWRMELGAINAWLAQAPLDYDPSSAASDHRRLHGAEPPSLPQSVSIHERYLRRIFNRGSFREGGRLSGGFWLTMPRAARLGLRVATQAMPNGEPFVLLDFKSMFLALLYAAKARVQPPLDRDLYEGIIGTCWPEDPREKAALRGAMKVNVNSLLFRDPRSGPRSRVTNGTRGSIPKHISARDLDQRICAAHPEIAAWLRGSDVGYQLMYLESQIMVRILLRCRSEDFIALPLHDGLLVPQSRCRDAKLIMEQAFREMTGFEARVDGPKSADGESDTMLDPEDASA